MQTKSRPPVKVLIYQSAGFLAIIAVCLVDERVGLTNLLFGDQTVISNYRETIFKMLLILAIWLLVNGATRRVLDRVRYLENFTKVCAWCRRVDFADRWMPLEEFLKQGFDSTTSHGICRDCLEQKKAAINEMVTAGKFNPIQPPSNLSPETPGQSA